MRRRSKRWLNSMMFRMLLAFLLTVTPILLGCAYVYRAGSGIAWSRAIRMVDAEQEYLLEIIERELTNICTTQLDMTLSEEITYMLNMDGVLSDYRRYKNIADVMERLNQITRNNYWISQVRLHIPSMNSTLTSDLEFLPLTQEYEQLRKKGTLESFVDYPILDDNFCIVTRYPLLKSEAQFYIVSQVRMDKLSSLLPPAMAEERMGLYLCTADYAHVFAYNQGTLPLLEQMLSQGANEGLPEKRAGRIELNGESYILREDSLFYDELRMVMLLPESSIRAEMDAYQKAFLFIGSGSILLIFVFLLVFNREVNRPIAQLMQACEQVRGGNLRLDIAPVRGSEFRMLQNCFVIMLERIERLIDDNYRQKILVQQMELKQLHAQVNPHFLHNSLLNIRAMAQMEDYEGIEDMTEKLSRYYLYVTKNHQDLVRLADEYEYTQLYVSIQSVRFGSRIRCEVQPLPDSCRELMIPRFIVQTLVENAYKYGASSREEDGVIRVGCTQKDGSVDIFVEDNGILFDDDKLRVLAEIVQTEKENDLPGTGLMNVALRMRLCYGKRGSLRILRSALGGLRAELYICREDE